MTGVTPFRGVVELHTMRRFVYILSFSYSGSTLLTFLLARHAQIATVGELKASALGDVSAYDCSCGRRIGECPFWSQVREALAQRGREFSVTRFGTHYRDPRGGLADWLLATGMGGRAAEALRDAATRVWPGAARRRREITRQNLALADVVCGLRGAPLFLDGSKDAHRLRFLLEGGAPDPRVIYMVRDGRAAGMSYIKHTGAEMTLAAAEWRRTHEECRNLLARLEQRQWTQVRHEDLCRDPQGELARLFAFLGLEAPAGAATLDPAEQHILGNAMRLRDTREIRLDEAWRERISAEQREVFERVAGDVNRAYGYGEDAMPPRGVEAPA